MKDGCKFLYTVLIFSISFAVSCMSGDKKTPEMRASDIVAMLDEGRNVNVSGCVVWGDLDFCGLKNIAPVYPRIFQTTVTVSVTFVNCVFTGKVSAYSENGKTHETVATVFARNLSFVDCDFRDEVNFAECVVEGNTFVTGSTFRRRADWQGAYFKHKTAYFADTEFEGEALFQNTVFAGDANFMNAKFAESAMFQKTRVAGNMIFGGAVFGGYADFSGAKAADALFRYADFRDRHDFSDSKMNIDDNVNINTSINKNRNYED